MQYLKSITFVQKAGKTRVHTSVSDKNQSSSQTKGFMLSLVKEILGTCGRVANKFLHPSANYTYMYNLHTVCKSAHVNGAIVDFNCMDLLELQGTQSKHYKMKHYCSQWDSNPVPSGRIFFIDKSYEVYFLWGIH